MTNEEWIKKAGKHLPEGGYNDEILAKCIYMFKEGYQEAIKESLEWLKSNLQDYAGEDSCRNSVPFDNNIFDAFRKEMEGE